MATTKKEPVLKRCSTVGALIKQLERLPKRAKLDAPVRPTYCNTGPVAKEMGLRPVVTLDDF